jgi:hypothetical protein
MNKKIFSFRNLEKFKIKYLVIFGGILILTNIVSVFVTKYFEESYYFKSQTFIELNRAVYETRQIVEEEYRYKFALLDSRAAEQPKRYEKLVEEVGEVENCSNNLITYIEEVKIILLDGINSNSESINDKFYSVKFQPLSDEVLDTIDIYLIEYLKLIERSIDDDDDSYYDRIDSCFNQNCSSDRIFSTKTFRNVTNFEAVLFLSFMQVKVRQALSYYMDYVVSLLHWHDGISSWDSYVSASSVVVKKGGVFNAEILTARQEWWSKPIFYITYDKPYYDSVIYDGYVEYSLKRGLRYEVIKDSEKGIGKYQTNCDETGLYEFGGLVQYKTSSGETWIPFKYQYYVTE